MVIHVGPLLDSQWLMGYLPWGQRCRYLQRLSESVVSLTVLPGNQRWTTSVAGNCSLLISLKSHFTTTLLLLFFIHRQNWRRGRVKALEPGWGNYFASDLFIHYLAQSFASFSQSSALLEYNYSVSLLETNPRNKAQGATFFKSLKCGCSKWSLTAKREGL